MAPFLLTGNISGLSLVLAEAFVAQGQEIIQLQSYSVKFNKTTNLLASSPLYTVLYVDSVNEDAILKILEDNQITTVIDASLLSGKIQGGPLEAASDLVLGITSVVDAVRKYGKVKKFVLLSGQEVYGNNKSHSETEPLTPVTFAGAAQMSVEAMVHSYTVSYRTPTVILRLGTVVTSVLERDDYDSEEVSNIVIASEAASAIRLILESHDFKEPAEIFNVTETPSNAKFCSRYGWKYGQTEPLPATFETINIKPKILIYGKTGLVKSEFEKLVNETSIGSLTVSSSNPSSVIDSEILKEMDNVKPSHIFYFDSDKEAKDGNSFLLRENVSSHLYTPWLLASICNRLRIRFVYVVVAPKLDASAPETSSSVVKEHSHRLLNLFESVLQFQLSNPISETSHDGNVITEALKSTEEREVTVTALKPALEHIVDVAVNSKKNTTETLVNPGSIKFSEIRHLLADRNQNNNASIKTTLNQQQVAVDVVKSTIQNYA